jgi:hypothetical protein
MVAERRLRRRKTIAWLSLLAGVAWLLIPLRNVYAPSFLRFAYLSSPDGASLAVFQVTAGILWLAVAWRGFWNSWRNPEGKTTPAVQTLFDRELSRR